MASGLGEREREKVREKKRNRGGGGVGYFGTDGEEATSLQDLFK